MAHVFRNERVLLMPVDLGPIERGPLSDPPGPPRMTQTERKVFTPRNLLAFSLFSGCALYLILRK